MVATVAMFSTVWAQSRRSSSQSASPSFPGLSTWNSGGSSSRDIPKSNLGAEGEGPRLWHEPAALPAHSLVRSVPAGLSPHLMASHKTNLPPQDRQQHPWPGSSAGWWSAPQRPQKAILSPSDELLGSGTGTARFVLN